MEVSYMKPKVVRGPASDGSGIVRLVEENGRVWAEAWGGPERGWVRGGTDVATVMAAIPPTREKLKFHKVPPEDWPTNVQ